MAADCSKLLAEFVDTFEQKIFDPSWGVEQSCFGVLVNSFSLWYLKALLVAIVLNVLLLTKECNNGTDDKNGFNNDGLFDGADDVEIKIGHTPDILVFVFSAT